jgi:hypothetical protein
VNTRGARVRWASPVARRARRLATAASLVLATGLLLTLGSTAGLPLEPAGVVLGQTSPTAGASAAPRTTSGPIAAPEPTAGPIAAPEPTAGPIAAPVPIVGPTTRPAGAPPPAGTATSSSPGPEPLIPAEVVSGGDPRSEGSGPGLVGSPLAILLGVVAIGSATAALTAVVARLTRRA